jgi:hypothetical protein|nr:MAG TPA: hypothetical protein [Caudoviricetes sp.]
MAKRNNTKKTSEIEPLKPKRKGPGGNYNPEGKGGFRYNPQNIHPGGWKKEDTPRFKMEAMMKLKEPELQQIAQDEGAPLFERRIATYIIKSDWQSLRQMIHEVYGTPKQSVQMDANGAAPVALVKFAEPINDEKPEDSKAGGTA